MRSLLVCCVLLSTVLAGCHADGPGSTDGMGDGEDGNGTGDGGGGGTPIEGDWDGDTEVGIECRLVQPQGALALGETGPLRVEYDLANPARFDAVEVELGDGLVLEGGALREDDPGEDQVVSFTVEVLEAGEHIVHAYVVWAASGGGNAESCSAFDVHVSE